MFAKTLGRHRDVGVFILRAGLGAMFMVAHGAGKLFGGPAQWETLGRAMQHVGVDAAPVVWGLLAAITEFFGGFFLLLGLYVRPTALAMTAVMVVASLSTYARAGNFMGSAAHPVEVGIALLALFFLGAGKYSLDQKLGYT